MIITKLHIENFGKLHDLDMDFCDGINQLYKENGWGKSSLSVFIKAMFYGMPAKSRGEAFNYERSRFAPWQGGNYGGFIQIKTSDKEYKITRYFGKTPEGDSLEILDLTNNQKLQKLNNEIGEMLFGIGRESFEVTAYFPQLKFVSSSNSQITANLTGVDKFQNDLANFNQAIKIIDSRISNFKKNKPKKDEIETLYRHINENKSLIEVENRKVSVLKDELNNYENKIISYKQVYKNEKDRISQEQNLFDKKLEIEEKIREKSGELNNLLLNKNEILEKMQCIKENNNQKKNSNSSKTLTFILPILLVILVATFSCLIAFNILSLLVGIILIVASLLIIGTIEIFMLKKKTKDNSSLKNENNLDKDISNDLQKVNSLIQNLNDEINALNEDYLLYNNCQSPNRENLDKLDGELHEINIGFINKKNQIENLKKEIDSLIETNDKMQTDYNEMKEQYNQIDDKIKILSMTKEYMTEARENVSKRFIVPINNSFSQLLKKFNIDDRKFIIDTEWKVKEETNFGTKEFEYSSQGLQDIISFCQRINLIGELYKREKPIIILDDTFVNLDDKKLFVAKELVKEISKTYQVLYICCNDKNLIK